MHLDKKFSRSVRVAALSASLLFFSAAFAGPADSSRPSAADLKADAAKTAAANQAVKTAAAALQKEFEAHLKAESSPLRTECNFFTENADPAITPQAIITGLHRSYGSTAESVYVHWQLLSGISGTVDESLASSLMALLRNAPMPPMRPGMSADDKAQLTKAVVGLKEEDADKINTGFQAHIDAWTAASSPFLEYRDALGTKVSGSFELVISEFQDAVGRASDGIDAQTTMDNALAAGRNWATGDAKPEQLQNLSQGVTGLLKLMGVNTPPPGVPAPVGGTPPVATFPPKYFATVAWDDHLKSLQWRPGSARFTPAATLVDFRKALNEQLNQPDAIKPKTAKGS